MSVNSVMIMHNGIMVCSAFSNGEVERGLTELAWMGAFAAFSVFWYKRTTPTLELYKKTKESLKMDGWDDKSMEAIYVQDPRIAKYAAIDSGMKNEFKGLESRLKE